MPKHFVPSRHPEWIQLHANFALNRSGAAFEEGQLPADSGIYLWTVCQGASEYALYIGKANSVRKRIYNYTQPFQPHSPNDKKLYFAQAALRKLWPDASFPLYWRPFTKESLNSQERTAIASLGPALNDRGKYSELRRDELESIYRDLYVEVVSRQFGEA